MILEIRNTFFHVSEGDEVEKEYTCSRRARSTPPESRLGAASIVSASSTDLGAALHKTALEHGSPPGTQCSTQASDDECSHTELDTELCYTIENEADASLDSEQETDTGADDDWVSDAADLAPSLNAARVEEEADPGTPEVVTQQQLENMSQKVIGIWASLNALEAQFSRTCACSPAVATKTVDRNPLVEGVVETTQPQNVCLATSDKKRMQNDAIQTLRLAAFVGAEPPTSRRAPVSFRSTTLLDTRAQLFKPAAPPSEVDNVLVTTKEILAASSCVAAVAVSPSASGDLTSIAITLAKPWRSSTGSRSVTATAKAALMEATAASRSVYILGYEADPFEDHSYGPGFSTALVLAPYSWQSSACWDTYRRGHCPRGATCRWKHPGRSEIRPVRVIIA